MTETEMMRRLVEDFPFFAEHCLKIRPKDVGRGLQDFVLNPAQVELHRQLEEIRERDGMVRALVLKGRQMGVSTYVGARYYHKTITSPGSRTFILTQEMEATDALLEVVLVFRPVLCRAALWHGFHITRQVSCLVCD